jgi:hypothetical protein
MTATKSEELDQILLGIPSVEQTGAVEDAAYIRFTIQLRIDPSDHPNPPEIFIIFTQSEFMQLRSAPRMLETALRNRIERTTFKDGSSGAEIRTSLRREGTGIWVAITVDGSMWEFDSKKDRWIKGPVNL